MTLKATCKCGHTPPDFNSKCERCEFVRLIFQVKELRDTQKKFFKTRSPQWLNVSKELEKKIDTAISELENPQMSLFPEGD